MVAGLAGHRVLLVEDDEDGAMLMAMTLEREGAEVHHAASVAAAVEALSGAAFRVLVADLELPDGTGVDLIARCRVDRPELARRSLALTGHADAATASRLAAAGFADVLAKPAQPDALVDRVARLAGAATASRPGSASP
jgi:two-component system CheB/CheR fusion protein